MGTSTKQTKRHPKRQVSGAKSSRRVGAETSKTRAVLLDSTEQLMLDEGYAAVTYRRVAAAAGVTAPLVQYYFPTLDDLFTSLLQRRSEQNLEKLTEALTLHSDEPLRVIWEYSTDETTAALLMEFMALANHRKAIRAEIAEVSERSRKVQLAALSSTHAERPFIDENVPTSAVLFLLHGIPKLILMESFLGLRAGHRETLALIDRYLESAEPSAPKTKPRAGARSPNSKRQSSSAAQRDLVRKSPTRGGVKATTKGNNKRP